MQKKRVIRGRGGGVTGGEGISSAVNCTVPGIRGVLGGRLGFRTWSGAHDFGDTKLLAKRRTRAQSCAALDRTKSMQVAADVSS